jgi:hypothetical protein
MPVVLRSPQMLIFPEKCDKLYFIEIVNKRYLTD